MVGCWHGHLSGARCRFAYGPADATATAAHSVASVESRLAHPGNPGQSPEGRKTCTARARLCVCVADEVMRDVKMQLL